MMERAGREPVSGIQTSLRSPQQLLDEAEDSELGTAGMLLAWEADALVGFAGLSVWYDDFYSQEERCLFVRCLYVQPDHRRRGIGSILIKEAVAVAASRGLPGPYAEVNASNLAMRGLLEKEGWSVKSTVCLLEPNRTNSPNNILRLLWQVSQSPDIRCLVILTGRRSGLSLPELGRGGGAVALRLVNSQGVGELARLGYSDWAVEAAAKGKAVVAIKDGNLVGACLALGGIIDHVVSPQGRGISEKVVPRMISELPAEMEDITISVEDPSLALSVHGWGFEVSSILIRADGDRARDLEELALNRSLGPSFLRFIIAGRALPEP